MKWEPIDGIAHLDLETDELLALIDLIDQWIGNNPDSVTFRNVLEPLKDGVLKIDQVQAVVLQKVLPAVTPRNEKQSEIRKDLLTLMIDCEKMLI